jgi:hypothetical protein
MTGNLIQLKCLTSTVPVSLNSAHFLAFPKVCCIMYDLRLRSRSRVGTGTGTFSVGGTLSIGQCIWYLVFGIFFLT